MNEYMYVSAMEHGFLLYPSSSVLTFLSSMILRSAAAKLLSHRVYLSCLPGHTNPSTFSNSFRATPTYLPYLYNGHVIFFFDLFLSSKVNSFKRRI